MVFSIGRIWDYISSSSPRRQALRRSVTVRKVNLFVRPLIALSRMAGGAHSTALGNIIARHNLRSNFLGSVSPAASLSNVVSSLLTSSLHDLGTWRSIGTRVVNKASRSGNNLLVAPSGAPIPPDIQQRRWFSAHRTVLPLACGAQAVIHAVLVEGSLVTSAARVVLRVELVFLCSVVCFPSSVGLEL